MGFGRNNAARVQDGHRLARSDHNIHGTGNGKIALERSQPRLEAIIGLASGLERYRLLATIPRGRRRVSVSINTLISLEGTKRTSTQNFRSYSTERHHIESAGIAHPAAPQTKDQTAKDGRRAGSGGQLQKPHNYSLTSDSPIVGEGKGQGQRRGLSTATDVERKGKISETIPPVYGKAKCTRRRNN